MKRTLYFLSFLLLITAACKKDNSRKDTGTATNEPKMLTFLFLSTTNPTTLSVNDTLEINGQQISGALPLSDVKVLVPTFTTSSNTTVKVGGQIQQSGKTPVDFSKPVTYEIAASNGVKSTYVVSISAFHGIPIIYIETANGVSITSKENYLNGHLTVNGNNLFTSGIYNGDIQIKGRGNTTWGQPKKPFKLKLPEKSEMLGMPASKDWVLLANYMDKSLLRNSIAFELGNRFSMTYTPRSQMVDLILNGRYVGTYLLCEQIKIAKDRVNITEMEESDVAGDALTGGYLLEVNERMDDEVNFRSSKYQVALSFNDPEEPTTEQLAYMKKYIADLEATLASSTFADPVNGYAKYLNTSTFVDFFLINELMKNHDADFQGSVYLYKDRNGKMSIGPLWDFDIAAGNINYDGAEKTAGWRISKNKWYKRLFDDPAFRKLVKDRWNALKLTKINNLNEYIDQQVKYIDKSQKANFVKWDILNTYVWPNAVVTGSYKGEINYLKTWLKDRTAWMDGELNNGSY